MASKKLPKIVKHSFNIAKIKTMQKCVGLSSGDIIELIGSEVSKLNSKKLPPKAKPFIDALTALFDEVMACFDDDSSRVSWWFQLPNPMLGFISPRDLIRMGRVEKVLYFARQARVARSR